MKKIISLFFCCFCGLLFCSAKTVAIQISPSFESQIQLSQHSDTLFCVDTSVQKLTPHQLRKRKLVSAMLAFPFPFGFMGAHRVMLGCKPWVPIVYVATFGGCFGLLPLIDFCAIVFSKDIEQYENNPHIFMWIK